MKCNASLGGKTIKYTRTGRLYIGRDYAIVTNEEDKSDIIEAMTYGHVFWLRNIFNRLTDHD